MRFLAALGMTWHCVRNDKALHKKLQRCVRNYNAALGVFWGCRNGLVEREGISACLVPNGFRLSPE